MRIYLKTSNFKSELDETKSWDAHVSGNTILKNMWK